MIIRKPQILDVERIGDQTEGLEAGIDSTSLPYVFQILSSKFYSDSIGSLVREIASNCVDAHTEANVTAPVIIRKGVDEEGEYIEFVDHGTGMSPEILYNVYNNYFSSTKRDTNSLIGGFGLGSKTPLAYTDFFYITTVVNKKEYSCIYHKGTEKPTLESLYGYESTYLEHKTVDSETREAKIVLKKVNLPAGIDTDKENGTTIRVNIIDGDTGKFHSALRKQLKYFTNIIYENWEGIQNDYTIYECEYFKFRVSNETFSYRMGITSNYISTLHLCLGNVFYPIDTSQVPIPENMFYCPVGIKFDIGELEVVPNREGIVYTDTARKLIADRIALAYAEITRIHYKQSPKCDTLIQYLRESEINDRPVITFSELPGHILPNWTDSKIDAAEFPTLDTIGIKKLPTNPFFAWKVIGKIVNGVYVSDKNNRYFFQSAINKSLLLDNKAYMIANTGTFQLSNTTAAYIGERFDYPNIWIVVKSKLDIQEYNKNLKFSKFGTGTNKSKATVIRDYNKMVDNTVIEKSLGNCADFVPSAEWIKAYKRERYESTAAYQRKINKTIFARVQPGGYKREFSISELQKYTGILVWGTTKNKSTLASIGDMLYYYYKYSNPRSPVHKIILVSEASKKLLEENVPNGVCCEEFIHTKVASKIYSKIWLTLMYRTTAPFPRNIGKYIKDYQDTVEKLLKYISSYNYKASDYDMKEWIRLFGDSFLPELSAVELWEKYYKLVNKTHLPLRGAVKNADFTEKDVEEYTYLLKRFCNIRLSNIVYLKSPSQILYEKNVRHILDVLNGKKTEQLLLTYKTQTNG